MVCNRKSLRMRGCVWFCIALCVTGSGWHAHACCVLTKQWDRQDRAECCNCQHVESVPGTLANAVNRCDLRAVMVQPLNHSPRPICPCPGSCWCQQTSLVPLPASVVLSTRILEQLACPGVAAVPSTGERLSCQLAQDAITIHESETTGLRATLCRYLL